MLNRVGIRVKDLSEQTPAAYVLTVESLSWRNFFYIDRWLLAVDGTLTAYRNTTGGDPSREQVVVVLKPSQPWMIAAADALGIAPLAEIVARQREVDEENRGFETPSEPAGVASFKDSTGGQYL